MRVEESVAREAARAEMARRLERWFQEHRAEGELMPRTWLSASGHTYHIYDDGEVRAFRFRQAPGPPPLDAVPYRTSADAKEMN